jgi:hypothetical protein
VTSGINVAFGKAAPGATHPAVFLVGTVDGVAGVFRSDNTGTAWVRINDDAHQYGNMGDALAGDPRIYGRVYLGTNGRGILYADRQGGPSSPTPTTTTPSTTSPTTPPTTTPTTSPTTPPTTTPTTPPTTTPTTPPTTTPTSSPGACTATYKVTGQWSGGFQGEVTVANTGTAAVRAWIINWEFADGQTVTQLWGGSVSQTGSAVRVTNAAWNGSLAAGASTTFGFLGNSTGTTNPVPSPVSCSAS